MHRRTLYFGTILKDRLRPLNQPIAQQGIHTRGYSEARYGGAHHTGPATETDDYLVVRMAQME
jgi:hypothetical protein